MLQRVLFREPSGRGNFWLVVAIGVFNLFRGLSGDPVTLLLGVGLTALGVAELIPRDQITAAGILRGAGLLALILSLLFMVSRFF